MLRNHAHTLSKTSLSKHYTVGSYIDMQENFFSCPLVWEKITLLFYSYAGEGPSLRMNSFSFVMLLCG